jgi:hypothetical protein
MTSRRSDAESSVLYFVDVNEAIAQRNTIMTSATSRLLQIIPSFIFPVGSSSLFPVGMKSNGIGNSSRSV